MFFSYNFLQWMPLVRNARSTYSREIPVILVGCKSDVRNYSSTHIQREHGESEAEAIKAQYKECSAETHEGVHELFAAAVRTSLGQQEPEQVTVEHMTTSGQTANRIQATTSRNGGTQRSLPPQSIANTTCSTDNDCCLKCCTIF